MPGGAFRLRVLASGNTTVGRPSSSAGLGINNNNKIDDDDDDTTTRRRGEKKKKEEENKKKE